MNSENLSLKSEEVLEQLNPAHGVDNSYHKMVKPKRTIAREKARKSKGKKKYGFK